MSKLTDFVRGFIVGVITALIICGLICGIIYTRKQSKEIIEYVETQKIIEELREDYGNRDPIEFIDTIPDVRRAADGAAAEFERKRDEALERFRGGLTGR